MEHLTDRPSAATDADARRLIDEDRQHDAPGPGPEMARPDCLARGARPGPFRGHGGPALPPAAATGEAADLLEDEFDEAADTLAIAVDERCDGSAEFALLEAGQWVGVLADEVTQALRVEEEPLVPQI
ncbi:MAG: hypothetical protein SYC29_04900, partial [Planctomycetota bacterium]|nr:hypothetical protein [Planctomycetota bacterium]